ncbi:hypothetical protein [Desulfovibrio ferrophilus]|uniref:Uncharacterized protein n=1 Tax=Desulfovibrio ferrophilus TaxID=241368 RepID=A0A2Z6B2G7_9BACT|nr:hypothetical protein [Desulfovibrio ferrophilus]BBD09620.1 uncharacterized protein DFE_2894 [Desulfovibrio ferrophilus]
MIPDVTNIPWSLVGALLLCSFFPLAAISFLCYRMPKKKNELKALCTALGIKADDEKCPYFLFKPQDEYSIRDYVLPMGFCMFYCFCAFWLLFDCHTLGLSKDCSPIDTSNLILQGIFPYQGIPFTYAKVSLVATLVAVLGCYVWSIQYVARRLVTLDLFPSAFYTIATRLVFSTFIALALRHLLFANAEGSLIILPPLAFFIGMFPQRGLRYLQNRFSPTFKEGKQAHALHLGMIEGINLFTHTRLSELGIDNAQNLAEANFIEILIKTPFTPNLLMDWMAQAMLYVRVRDRIEQLRTVGIRTIFDLQNALTTNPEKLAEALEWERSMLNIIAASIDHDQTLTQLKCLRDKLLAPNDLCNSPP